MPRYRIDDTIQIGASSVWIVSSDSEEQAEKIIRSRAAIILRCYDPSVASDNPIINDYLAKIVADASRILRKPFRVKQIPKAFRV